MTLNFGNISKQFRFLLMSFFLLFSSSLAWGESNTSVSTQGPSFDLLWSFDRSKAIRTWIRSLPQYRDLYFWSFQVSEVANPDGLNNLGIFEVRVANQEYIAKVTRKKMNHCGDLEHLVRLNSYQVTQAQDGMPIVSRILAATQNDQFCVALLEKAKGQSLHELYTILETTQPGTEILNFVAYDFGRKMGAMHFGSAISGDPEPLGFRASLHMDAHGGNVIYDLFTRELTLINNMHLNNYSYREWMSIDLFKNNYLSLRITHSLLEGLKTYRLSKHLYGQDHERFINQSFEYFNYFAIGYLESFPRELQLQIQPKFMEFCNLDAFRAQLARYPGWFEFLVEWADRKFEAREKCMRGDFLPTPSFDTDQFEQDSIRKIEAYLKTQKHTDVQPSFWKIWDLLKKASEIRTIM